MSPLDQLSNQFSISKVSGASDWHTYEVKTPAHRFLNFVKWFPAKDLCCEFTARDDFPNELLTKLLRFTDEHIAELFCETHIKKLLSSEIPFFGTAVYINHECHTAFKLEMPSLHPRTLVAFPAYNCEFSGDESPGQIRCMRSDFVTTIDWIRQPAPKVLMRYDNRKTKSKSIAKKLGLDRAAILMNEVKNLEGAPESFIEVENFRHQQCLIVSKGSKNHISFGDLELSPSDTANFVSQFIRSGMN